MPGDQRIVSANRLTRPLQRGPDIRGLGSGAVIERQHLEPGGKPVDLAPVVRGFGGFRGGSQQFVQYNSGNAECCGASWLERSRNAGGRSRRTRMLRLVLSM
jgi:hypothetical protein